MSGETEEDYFGALVRVKGVFLVNRLTRVVVTDRELALMSSIQIILGDAFNLLCIWHIEKNIVANLKKHFRTNGGWERFLADWHLLVASIDVETFIANLKVCKYPTAITDRP